MTEIKVGSCVMMKAGGPKLTITQVQIIGIDPEKQRVTGTFFNTWLEKFEYIIVHPDAVSIVPGFEEENNLNNSEN
ncbi:MAG: hypothetical protein IPL55_15425 [Saprospiraceae bacterium]|nr:hypothetical protein [Saprospiraceae bacterium]